MKPKLIPAETAFAKWRQDPAYVAEFDALAGEFALAEAAIVARTNATSEAPRRPHRESDSP